MRATSVRNDIDESGIRWAFPGWPIDGLRRTRIPSDTRQLRSCSTALTRCSDWATAEPTGPGGRQSIQTVADRPPRPSGVTVKALRIGAAVAVVALASACGGATAHTTGLLGAPGTAKGSGLTAAVTTGVSQPAAVGRAVTGSFVGAPIVPPVSQPSPPAGIEVTGTGMVSGTPDAALLSMSVQATSVSVASAMGQITSDMNRVLGALHGDGVATADIATSGLNIGQNYGPQGPDGYQASESVTVKLHPLSAAGRTISDAVAAGGSDARLDGISLDFSDDSALVQAARAQAFAQAKAEAQQYAALAGRPLGAVESITEGFSSPEPLPMGAQGAAAVPANTSLPVNPGTQQVSVSVQVVWALG